MTRPSSGADRLLGLDLARYVAFVGMVIVNFKIAMGAEGGAGLAAAVTSAIEGRAAATFVVLAGIGLGLAGQAGLAQTGAVTLRRALFLLALGLVNMTIFEADILHYYAVYFVFGVALLQLGSAGLIAVMAGLNGLALVMILSLDFDQGWDWQSYHYADFWTAAGFLRNLFFNGWHPVVPWLGFLVFGVLLSRQALAERAGQLRLVLGGGLAVALAEAGSGMLAPVLASIDPELAVLAGTDPV
ncbi:MAG: heparan-alpha-glucosaminide N-acetyltransferase domain-containing protein, partial [Pseudomonadota bacterium]|nr:heparan-alpha-glucosaminide N-acetyltransferase domain-containing protein [Pseudomonadota bacterium]